MGIHYFSYCCLKTRLCTRWNRLAEAVLTSTHNLYYEQKYEKYQSFLSKKSVVFFVFFVGGGGVKFSVYLNKRVCVMYYIMLLVLKTLEGQLSDKYHVLTFQTKKKKTTTTEKKKYGLMNICKNI